MMKLKLDWVKLTRAKKLLFIVVFLASLAASASGIHGTVEKVGEATHIVFSGMSEWNYKVRRDGNLLYIELPKLNTKSRQKFQSWKDDLVKSMSLVEGVDRGDEIIIDLKRTDAESFDYLTDQPSRLIVDIYLPDPEEKKAEIKKKESKKSAKVASKKSNRKPAGTEFIQSSSKKGKKEEEIEHIDNTKSFGIFDGSDPTYERFTILDSEIDPSAIIASRRNIYIPFPALELRAKHLEKLWKSPPLYKISKTDDAENQKVRFLNSLFEKGRYAVFLRTLKFFRESYPVSSRYDELLNYMEADTYYNLWRRDNSSTDFETAISKYQQILEKYPNSRLRERIHLLIGFSYVYKKDPMGAISSFERYLREFPNSKFKYLAEISNAKSLALLRQYENSIQRYESVANDNGAGVYRVEAKYRIGDVNFQKKNYKGAIEDYKSAKNTYPTDWKRYPNALYNTAEAQFFENEYKDSLNSYVEFLKAFPKHEHGGFAMTRIGELLQILGADKKKILGAFFESMFRFHGSEGASLSKIRLLALRMKNLKDKDIEATIEEINKFVENSKLPKIKAFSTLAISDGYYDREEYEKAFDLLVGFYKNNPVATTLPIFRTRIERTIISHMRDLIAKDDFLETLRLYGKHASAWLKSSDRIDMIYYLGRAFEKAGVPEEADKMYRQALNKLYAISGTRLEKERGVFEKLPSKDAVNLRLASVEVKRGRFARAFKYLKDIDHKNAKLTETEDVERVEITSQIAEERGQTVAAMKYLESLTKTWKGEPQKVSRPLLRLAEIRSTRKEFSKALLALEKILILEEDSQFIPDDIHAEALKLQGDVHLKTGKTDLAIKSYQKLLDSFESQRPLDSTRYKVGQLYFKNGKMKNAEQVWSKLNQESVWARMAQEQLGHAQFKDGYKKYIDRIPAMAGMRKDKGSKE